jgi:hypothetical protein
MEYIICDRDAEFEINLKEPVPEFTPEHIPTVRKETNPVLQGHPHL